MACVENLPVHPDSEREEGEIVDELDELSDISSEEEFLLRQRLHMLEKYNNVLERKNAKRTIFGPGKYEKRRTYFGACPAEVRNNVTSNASKILLRLNGKNDKNSDAFLCDLSEISATELEEPYVVSKDIKEQKHLKPYHKTKRRKDPAIDSHIPKKVHRKKSHKYKKKTAVLPESSDESDDEYRNKRRKLANAVAVNKTNIDKTSLKARLEKMQRLQKIGNCVSQSIESDKLVPDQQTEIHLAPAVNDITLEIINSPEASTDIEKDVVQDSLQKSTNMDESVDVRSDVEPKDCEVNGSIEIVPPESHDTVDSVRTIANTEQVIINETQNGKDSDEDLELLREHALKTKLIKSGSKNSTLEKHNSEEKDTIQEKDSLLLSEDEDSDTAELRMICLKSALLKKAIEMKRKQKLRKRLSQSSNLNDELMKEQTEYINQIVSENNTDTESVDMDIGSDGDEKSKDFSIESLKPTDSEYETVHSNKNNLVNMHIPKEDELEEDEDLLRAKLLTSLSKNLPNLVDPTIINNITEKDLQKKDKDDETEKQANNVPEEKRFIISLGNSDSEGEHEATKNLTKMHMKLSEQIDFQQRLDLFLKSTRLEVEKSALPDVVQQPAVPSSPKTKEKFVPKTVKHLPKSEQIEYKNLVKRMAELEKIKNARQSSISLVNVNKGTAPIKDTLKPRNTATQEHVTNKNLEEQIALSRKTIAEESAKVLKLKEEATKLSQKYKIVTTELRNIATAISFNKKEQRAAQIKLSKIRAQHQLLINSSNTSKHSISNGNIDPVARGSQKITSNSTKRPQKENAPVKEEVKSIQLYSKSTLNDLQSVKVSVVNDRMDEPNPRLSVQIDVTSNKKTVKLPKSPVKNSFSLEKSSESRITDVRTVETFEPHIDSGGRKKDKELTICNWGSKNKLKDDDYKSPLQALGSANWPEDPNAVLCRFEVGGNCKDPDCKYLHPRTHPEQ